MDLQIFRNEEAGEFQTEVEGHRAFIEYKLAQGRIYLTHTEVPKVLGGRGIGSSLVEGVLEQIEEANEVLFPLCPFVASYIRKHPEWKRILAPGVNV